MSSEQKKQLQINRRNFLKAGAAATFLGAAGILKTPGKFASAANNFTVQYAAAPKGQWSKIHPVHDMGSATVRYVEHNDQWLGTTKIVGKIKNISEADHATGLTLRHLLGEEGANGVGDKAFRGYLTQTPRSPLNTAIGQAAVLLATPAAVAGTGKPNPDKLAIPDPEQMSMHIKDLGYFLHADDIAIGKMPEYAYYSYHCLDVKGMAKKPLEECIEPVTERLPYVIGFVKDQHLETMLGSTGYDGISDAQSFNAYIATALISVIIANYIRRLGYNARASHAFNNILAVTPCLVAAGLGEMCRTGNTSLHPRLGFRHKAAVVTTDLPLAPDKPIDFGLQDFCRVCKKCAAECPAQAISYDADPVEYNGYLRWNVNSKKCSIFRTSNEEGISCGRCMKVCPWDSKEDSWFHQAGTWIGSQNSAGASLLKSIDDMFGYGTEQILDYKWWLEYPEMYKIPETIVLK
ncbi:reductive dehalogenase [Dehalobacter sp. MCB1]|uniref:reductive dehalogenase n=1 Tax=unclassified Dehalobacter TaxID=2635733 RepID=UPI000E6CC54F|nr:MULTISPECIES: reductive dehalogenase [unclassified Dehalobacter]RJE47257.1 reductive dehalogenase [Dehalobacter sp. MCB1]TCX54889.1 reductive dehalogenase [Dehalobacter sp. 12DCB1]